MSQRSSGRAKKLGGREHIFKINIQFVNLTYSYQKFQKPKLKSKFRNIQASKCFGHNEFMIVWCPRKTLSRLRIITCKCGWFYKKLHL